MTMNKHSEATLNRLEKELLFTLKEEYSFYQSLYIMMDKQRDSIKYKKDDELLDLFSEIERCRERIKKSEDKLATIRGRDPELFVLVMNRPTVAKVVNSIATLIKKNLSLVKETEEYLRGKYERIKAEIGELQTSQKIIQYMGSPESSAHLIDGRK